MNKTSIPIYFGPRWIIFFILLETLTVPMVAMSNNIATQSILYMSLMGFFVAFICVVFLVRILHKLIIKHSLSLIGVHIERITGLWYIGVLAGILLMVMFFIQDILFSHGWDDYSTGFVSAFVSVGITLLVYQLVCHISGFAINLADSEHEYQLNFRLIDVLILSVFFGFYEFVACPVTGLWIPYPKYRLILAFVSGVIGGGGGGVLLYCLSRFLPVQLGTLQIIKNL